jgi:O-antigen/teichoic acid export membrane protein
VVGVVISAAAASTYYSTLMPAQQAWSTLCRMIANSLPAVNEMYGRSAFGRLKEIFIKIHRYNFLLAIPLAAGIVLLNHDVIRIWLKDHAEQQYGGELMTLSLAVIAVMITAGSVNFIFILATGRIRQISFLYLMVGGAKLVISAMLAKWLGLGAVTAATAVATMVTFISMQTRAQSELGVGWAAFLQEGFWPALLPSLFGAALLWVMHIYFRPENMLQLLLFVGVYLPIQGAISIWAVKREDRRLVWQQLGAVFGWPKRMA